MSRPQVLGRGFPFAPTTSSNSTRRPVLFDWTDAPDEATVDTVVDLDYAIGHDLDLAGDHRRIAWILESPATVEAVGLARRLDEDLDEIMGHYEVLLTSDRRLCTRHPRIRYHPAGSNLPWVPDAAYGLYAKDRMVSMIASGKQDFDGHRVRWAMAERLQDRVDLFGGAAGSPMLGEKHMHGDKRGGLCRYRFSICMENIRRDLYYSEKLTDCFATGTVPVYWGSDRIGEVFDPAGIIVLDDGFDPADLTVDLYESMLPAVRRNLDHLRRLWGADDLLYRRYLAPAADRRRGPLDACGWSSLGLAEANRRRTRRRAGPELLVAARSPKQYVDVLASIPHDRLTVRPLETATVPPRRLGETEPPAGWHSPLEQALLLHVPDCFVGDNVLFDEHRWYGLGNWWAGHQHQYGHLREVHHIDAGLLVSGWGGDAFQHFIIDALPRLAAAIELLETPALADVSVVSHRDGAEAAQWFWDRLGLAHRVVQKPRHPQEPFVVHADLALLVEFTPTVGELGYLPAGVLRPIQERLGVLDGPAHETVLYLWREGRRGVADQERLIRLLDAEAGRAGLELDVRRGGADLSEDLLRTRRARLVIGPHGGAFANLAFARPGAAAIEFLPYGAPLAAGEEVRSMYWGLAQAAGLDYWAVEPQGFGFEEAEMVVDLDVVVETVRAALT